MTLNPSVGVNEGVNVTLDSYMYELKKDYFSVSVFTASRSCSLQSSEHSHFHYESSLVSCVDYTTLINTNQSLTLNTTESTSITWEDDVAAFSYLSMMKASILPSPILRLTFTLVGNVQSILHI